MKIFLTLCIIGFFPIILYLIVGVLDTFAEKEEVEFPCFDSRGHEVMDKCSFKFYIRERF